MIGARINVWNSQPQITKELPDSSPTASGWNVVALAGSDGDGIGFDPFVVKGEVYLTNNEDGTKGFHGDVELTLGTFTASLIAGFGKYGTLMPVILDQGDYIWIIGILMACLDCQLAPLSGIVVPPTT